VTVQSPERPRPQESDIDSGVIKDARNRQQRHRVAGVAAASLMAIAAGLIVGFSGGGSGPGIGNRGHRQAPASVGGNPGSSRSGGTFVATAPRGISQSGLLAPGVGWVATQNGLSMTRDGGQTWIRVHVPGLGSDATAGIAEDTSPARNQAVLVVNATHGSCAWPGHSGLATPIHAVTVSADAGRTWRTHTLSNCLDPYSLSFANARVGFMAGWLGAGPGSRKALYTTTDGGRRWRREGMLPFPGSITFATARLGLGMAFWSDATTGVAGTPLHIALYRSTDGGRSWERQGICGSNPRQVVSVICQTPVAEGPKSFYVPAVVTDNLTKRSRPIVYATTNGGRTWITRTLPAMPSRLQRELYGRNYLGVPFSAPDARHLFVLVGSNLYTSADGGRQWLRTRAPFGTLDFVSADYGWDMTGLHLYHTSNGGRTWRRFKQR